jgi:hypothetical protein
MCRVSVNIATQEPVKLAINGDKRVVVRGDPVCRFPAGNEMGRKFDGQ